MIEEITHPKKKAFLENYPTFKTITETARAIGIGRRTAHMWLSEDETFMLSMHALKKEMERELIETYANNIHDIALDSKTPAQSRILGSIFMLKAFDRDKYGDRPAEAKIVGDITIKMAIPPYQAAPQISIDSPGVRELEEGQENGQMDA